MITPISNHVQRTLDLMLYQFRNATNFRNLVAAFAQGYQDLEDQLNLIAGAFDLDTAVGDQLTIMGDWFGAPRNNLSDSDYRVQVRIKIFELHASGNNDELQTILKTITAGTTSYYWPKYPATMQLSTDGTSIPPNLWKTMIQFAGAGINLWLFLTHGLPPLACAKDPAPFLLGIGGDTLGLSDGSGFALGSTEPGSDPWLGGGAFCDVNPEDEIVSYEGSGHCIDVVYGGT